MSAVLDFDQAGYGFLLYDVASLIYWWTWPDKGEIDFGRSKSVLDEYERSRLLIEAEKQHIYDMLKLIILMGMGWFMFEDDDFANGRRKVELLNTLGSDEFYRRLLCQSSNPIGPTQLESKREAL